MDLGLEDKVALVSGGTSGIGLAISKRLSGEGCKVAIAGRERTKLERALAQINRAQGFVADVREPTQVKALVENVIAAFGRIDIVVSNAGTHLAGRLEDVEFKRLSAPLRDQGDGRMGIGQMRRTIHASARWGAVHRYYRSGRQGPTG